MNHTDKIAKRKALLYKDVLAKKTKPKHLHLFGRDLDYLSEIIPQSNQIYERTVKHALSVGLEMSELEDSFHLMNKISSDSILIELTNYFYKFIASEVRPDDSFYLANFLKTKSIELDLLREYIVTSIKYIGTIWDPISEFKKIKILREDISSSLSNKRDLVELDPLTYEEFWNIKAENLAWGAQILYEDYQLEIKQSFDYSYQSQS